MTTRLVELAGTPDVGAARRSAGLVCDEAGLRPLLRTRFLTAVSEVARNAVVHGGGGRILFDVVRRDDRVGVRAMVRDHGPGIRDIPKAMADGYSSTGSMGRGLGGTRRLVDEFILECPPTGGTRVEIVLWAR